MTGAGLGTNTVTVLEVVLTVLPVARAVAVTVFPAAKVAAASPLNVQVPLVCTVAVPMLVPFLKTVMTVPAASVEVPDTEVAPGAIGPLTTGAVVATEVTVTAVEAADTQLPVATACAVRLCPDVTLRPPILQLPAPFAVVVPI